MSSPWGKISTPVETLSLAEIMSEEYAHCLQEKELLRHKKKETERKNLDGIEELPQPIDNAELWDAKPSGSNNPPTYSEAAAQLQKQKQVQDAEKVNAIIGDEWEDYSTLLVDNNIDPAVIETLPPEVLELIGCDSDDVIAQLLQSQYDQEYNEEIKRIERKLNQQSKVTVTLDKFRRTSEAEYSDEKEEPYDDDEEQKCDWDRFETNEKKLDAIPKCGFKLDKEGEMITKHDAQLCGVRNACRVMSFPPEFSTGDAASFDMKLTNQVFNQLKTYSRRVKKNNMADRKINCATAEMGVDVRTRLVLYKLINNQILEQINGIVSTGKEAVILHAKSDPTYTGAVVDSKDKRGGGGVPAPPKIIPKECAIKIFKTTLNEFKQRDRYIKDDYRFKERFSKQNTRVVITMWAEKEMHNLMRMQSVGIKCPDVVMLKQHILVMSFIGDNRNAAPKLKDVRFSDAALSVIYEEIVAIMHKLYNEAKLVHADLSEYNILWYEDQCWIIDVAQAVEPQHPSALEFLMRDCDNIINFFTKRGLPNIYTKEQLFEHITALNAETHNAAMLERIHAKGASVYEATSTNLESCPDELKPLDFPFDLGWEKSKEDRLNKKIDKAANTFNVIDLKCSVEAVAVQQNQQQKPTADIVAVTNTAEN